MDVEQEFANVAFEILDKNALVKILENLNPVTVLSLCKSNFRFSEICSDQAIFKRLMKAHYPDFPIAENAKEQYMSIASGRGTDYYLQILETPEIPGFPGKYAKKAYTEPLENSIVFTIYGTKIRKGEKIWLYCRMVGEKPLRKATAFRTREDAIKSIPIMYDLRSADIYVESRMQEYLSKVRRVRKLGKLTSKNAIKDSVEFSEWLEERDYPYPLTVEGVRTWIEEKGYVRRTCRKTSGENALCVDFVISVTIA